MSRSLLRVLSLTTRRRMITAPALNNISLNGSQSTVNAATGGVRYKTTFKTNPEAINNDIHYSSQWGTGIRWGEKETETGMERLALLDSDKQARDWFAEVTKSLGCTVTVDEMGNQFAVRPGKKDGPPTYAGSHLDTQPTGGRYDGPLGVAAAINMVRTLHEQNIETEYPIGVVNWTNEEGARFPISMVSSGVWAGEIPLKRAHNLASVTRGEKATMRSELERIGYLGSHPCTHEATPMAAHFELHIEQGPILERESRKIGIVEGAQAYKWFTITVSGRDCHTGTTDLLNRADGLLAAAKMIVTARDVAYEEDGLASTGIIEAKPGATNTVPGTVLFSLDIRAKQDAVVARMEKRLRAEFADIAAGKQTKSSPRFVNQDAHPDVVKVEWRLDSDSPAIHFHKDCIACVQSATEDLFGKEEAESLTKRMVSGAGHDSVYTSKRVPTCMIFIPSRDGVSHNPVEYSSPEDCALGGEVLMRAVLKYDQLRKERA